MQSRWKRKNNEMTCPDCGYVYYSNNDDFNFCPNCGLPMNEEAELKVKVRWHDAKLEVPQDDGCNKLVVLNGQYDNMTFDNAIYIAAYYHAHGKHEAEWDIESFVRNIPSRLVTHWAELPDGGLEGGAE